MPLLSCCGVVYAAIRKVRSAVVKVTKDPSDPPPRSEITVKANQWPEHAA